MTDVRRQLKTLRLSERARWARAVAFATVAAGIAVFGHAWTAHAAPEWSVLAIAVVLLTTLARACTHGRCRGLVLLGSLTIAQAVVHVACRWASSSSGSAMDHMHMQPTGGAPRFELLGASMSMGTAPMLAVHAFALIAGAFVLLRLDAALWARARRAAGVLIRALTRVGASLRERAHDTRSPAPHGGFVGTDDAACGCDWFVAQTGRRGPPASLPTFA